MDPLGLASKIYLNGIDIVASIYPASRSFDWPSDLCPNVICAFLSHQVIDFIIEPSDISESRKAGPTYFTSTQNFTGNLLRSLKNKNV